MLQRVRPHPRLHEQIVFEFNENFSNFSADVLRAMSFGYQRAFTSLLWLRFLQHTPPKKMGKNEVSWIYRDLDALTELDPEFCPAYEHGGIFLSVITEDKRGAEQILLKGIRIFPQRWRIRAYLAYHYQFELEEPEKAAEQYLAGSKLPGAPYLLGVLASNFIQKNLGREQSIRFLTSLSQETKDPFMKRKFEEKLSKLKGDGKGGNRKSDRNPGD